MNKTDSIDRRIMHLKFEHIIQMIALFLAAASVYSSTMSEIKLNTEKIQAQKESIERIDKNVKSLVDHFIVKGIKN